MKPIQFVQCNRCGYEWSDVTRRTCPHCRTARDTRIITLGLEPEPPGTERSEPQDARGAFPDKENKAP